MADSVDVEEQFDDSLPDDDSQPSTSSLEAELREYKSRLGRLAQESGEEKARITKEYQEWATNWKAYYDEELSKRDRIISDLENDLIEKLDSDGARAVIASRDAREKMDKEADERRRAAMEQTARELNEAKGEALAVYPTLTEADLVGATTARGVWSLAARLDRERTLKSFEGQRPTREEEREREVAEVEQASRVPAPTSRAPQGTRQAVRVNPVEQQIAELEERRQSLLKRKRLSEAMAVLRQISALKAEL